jgi:hypothetical protein
MVDRAVFKAVQIWMEEPEDAGYNGHKDQGGKDENL